MSVKFSLSQCPLLRIDDAKSFALTGRSVAHYALEGRAMGHRIVRGMSLMSSRMDDGTV